MVDRVKCPFSHSKFKTMIGKLKCIFRGVYASFFLDLWKNNVSILGLNLSGKCQEYQDFRWSNTNGHPATTIIFFGLPYGTWYTFPRKCVRFDILKSGCIVFSIFTAFENSGAQSKSSGANVEWPVKLPGALDILSRLASAYVVFFTKHFRDKDNIVIWVVKLFRTK